MEVYFWIFASVIVISALGRLFLYFGRRKGVQTYELFESFIGILGTLGLYGYVYDVEFGPKLFWKIIFILLILSTIYSFFKFRTIAVNKKLDKKKAVLLVGSMGLLSLPATYMLGLYAYAS